MTPITRNGRVTELGRIRSFIACVTVPSTEVLVSLTRLQYVVGDARQCSDKRREVPSTCDRRWKP